MNAPPPPSRLLRTLLFAAGGLAIASGLALASLGVFHHFDASGGIEPPPSLASQHRTDPGAVFDRPLGTVPTPSPTPAPVAQVAPPPAVEPPLRESFYRLIIDKIGVNAGVYAFGLDANRVPEVPLNGSDVAWYNFSAPPGTGSNAVFAGHVTWGSNAVFYDLDRLQPGDAIALRADNGAELSYVVSQSFLVDPNDPASLEVMAPTSSDVITLITCGGSFYYTGDPVFNGDYTHRRIVRATLVGLSPAAGGKLRLFPGVFLYGYAMPDA